MAILSMLLNSPFNALEILVSMNIKRLFCFSNATKLILLSVISYWLHQNKWIYGVNKMVKTTFKRIYLQHCLKCLLPRIVIRMIGKL